MLARLRLLPTLMICAGALLALKLMHLSSDLLSVAPAMANASEGAAEPVKAGEEKGEAKGEAKGASEDHGMLTDKPPVVQANKAPEEAKPVMSPSEIAVLESLSKRRDEMDKRARELDMREQLLAAAEKRVQDRIDELKSLEKKVNVDIGQTDEKNEARLVSVVKMYEAMKPKDAARIFERLDMGVLIDVAKRMEPRKISAILAAMDPVAAQELTVELATGTPMGPVQRVPQAALMPNASAVPPLAAQASTTAAPAASQPANPGNPG